MSASALKTPCCCWLAGHAERKQWLNWMANISAWQDAPPAGEPNVAFVFQAFN